MLEGCLFLFTFVGDSRKCHTIVINITFFFFLNFVKLNVIFFIICFFTLSFIIVYYFDRETPKIILKIS